MAINRRVAARTHDKLARTAKTADEAIEHEKAAALYRRQAEHYDARAEGP